MTTPEPVEASATARAPHRIPGVAAAGDEVIDASDLELAATLLALRRAR